MLDFLVSFVTTPTIVLAIVACIGLMLQRKKASEVFSGTIKTAVGMLVLTAGTDIIGAALDPFTEIFVEVFNLHGVLPLDMGVAGAIQNSSAEIGRAGAIIMVLGFIGNIILARLTPLKYIFLTGHLTWGFSIIIAYSLVRAGLSELLVIIVGSIVLALAITMTPAIAQPIIRRATGNDEKVLGHFATLSILISALIGKLLGNKKKDAEKMNIPDSFSFLKETAISVSVIMVIFFVVISLVAGPEIVGRYAEGENYLVYAIMSALEVATGIVVLLYGVHMFLEALIPAFRGISEKCVPGAVPALDIPAFMPSAPNSLLLGFLSGIVGMAVGMFLCGPIFGIVPIMAIDNAFFISGMAGILGNALGGARGSIVAGAVQGFLTPLIVSLTFDFMNLAAIGIEGMAFCSLDPLLTAILISWPWIGLGVLAAIFVVLCVIEKKRKAKQSADLAQKI